MSGSDSIEGFLRALEEADWDKAARMIGPRFVAEGPAHEVLDGRTFLAHAAAMRAALPDLRYAVTELLDEGGGDHRAMVEIEGTHSVDYVPSLPSQTHVAASGRAISLRERIDFRLDYGKLASIRSPLEEGRGLLGPLAELGASLSHPGLLG